MLEANKIAEIMEILIEDCKDCPLGEICKKGRCSYNWGKFLKTKVKKDSVEKWD